MNPFCPLNRARRRDTFARRRNRPRRQPGVPRKMQRSEAMLETAQTVQAIQAVQMVMALLIAAAGSLLAVRAAQARRK
jgi:hypothetical protein